MNISEQKYDPERLKEILNKQPFNLDNYDNDDDEFTDEIDLKEAENQGFTIWDPTESDIKDSSNDEDIDYSTLKVIVNRKRNKK